jgi:hypothetical protein
MLNEGWKGVLVFLLFMLNQAWNGILVFHEVMLCGCTKGLTMKPKTGGRKEKSRPALGVSGLP